MISYRQPIYVLVLAFATVVSGFYVGRAAGRFGANPSAVAAQQLLSSPLPNRAGNWLMRKEKVLDPEVLKLMQCSAYSLRVYEHLQTGDRVTIAVLLGPPGPISVHTPEICYSSRDFTVHKSRTKISVEDSRGIGHEFWDVLLESHTSANISQRVLYAWSTGGSWEASNSPRFAYAGAPYLYKLQLAAGSRRTASGSDFDPSQDFLKSFLAQCESRLKASALPASNP
jgi:hypothetical protein